MSKKTLFLISLTYLVNYLGNGCKLHLENVWSLPESHLMCASFALHNFPFCHDPDYEMPINSTCVDTDHVFFPFDQNITLRVNNEEKQAFNVSLSIADVCHERKKLSWRRNQINMCGPNPSRNDTVLSDMQQEDMVTFFGDNTKPTIQCFVSFHNKTYVKTRKIRHNNVCSEQTVCKDCLPTCTSLAMGDGGAYVCGQSSPSLIPSSVQIKVDRQSTFALPFSNTVCFGLHFWMSRDVDHIRIYEWQQELSIDVWGTRHTSTYLVDNSQCTSFTGEAITSDSKMIVCATRDEYDMLWEKRMMASLVGQQLVIVSQLVGKENRIQELVKVQDVGPMPVTIVTDTWDPCMERSGFCDKCQFSCDAALKGNGLVKCNNRWVVEEREMQGIMTLDRLNHCYSNMLRVKKMKDVYFLDF